MMYCNNELYAGLNALNKYAKSNNMSFTIEINNHIYTNYTINEAKNEIDCFDSSGNSFANYVKNNVIIFKVL